MKTESYRYRTCNHVIHWAHFQQHLLDKAHFSARLQISNTFSEDRGKHAPDFSLAGDVTVLQQLHQAADAFRILDNEVCLQIKLTTHQLQNKVRQKENVWRDWIFMPFTFCINYSLFYVNVMVQQVATFNKFIHWTLLFDPAFNPPPPPNTFFFFLGGELTNRILS